MHILDPFFIVLALVLAGLFILASYLDARQARKARDQQDEADQYAAWKDSAFPETLTQQECKQMNAERWN